MRSARFPILIVCLFAVAAAAAPQPMPRAKPEAVGMMPARLQEATAVLNRAVTGAQVAGAVAAVARKGKVAYLEAGGMQDLETRAPMTERSLFRIYSMTKPVTAVAVMMLNEEGRFALDDPVSKYLPVFRDATVTLPDATRWPPAREITIRDRLLHTSGLLLNRGELDGVRILKAATVDTSTGALCGRCRGA